MLLYYRIYSIILGVHYVQSSLSLSLVVDVYLAKT